MRLLLPAVLLLSGAPASAQFYQTLVQPLEQIKQFLELSDAQVQAISTLNSEYDRFVNEKQQRIWQVQTEIAKETAKEPLDPFALGIRYAEIEALCRHMKDRAEKTRAENLGLLSPNQRVKLKVLEDAFKLAPVIEAAQYTNLMGGASSRTGFLGGSGGILGSVNGCTLQLPANFLLGIPTFNSAGAEGRRPAPR